MSVETGRKAEGREIVAWYARMSHSSSHFMSGACCARPARSARFSACAACRSCVRLPARAVTMMSTPLSALPAARPQRSRRRRRFGRPRASRSGTAAPSASRQARSGRAGTAGRPAAFAITVSNVPFAEAVMRPTPVGPNHRRRASARGNAALTRRPARLIVSWRNPWTVSGASCAADRCASWTRRSLQAYLA
jgi:hypothetical protein